MFLASPSGTRYALSLLSSHDLANKKRKRRYFPNFPVPTSHCHRSLATATTGASRARWPVALYVAAVVVYLWVYFLHPLGNLEDLPRWSLFTRLLLPEEILYRCRKIGCRFTESPIVFEDRRWGESKISWRESGTALWVLLRLGLDNLWGVPVRTTGSR